MVIYTFTSQNISCAICCLFRHYIFNFSWYFRHIMHNLSLSFAVRLICLFYRTGTRYAIPWAVIKFHSRALVDYLDSRYATDIAPFGWLIKKANHSFLSFLLLSWYLNSKLICSIVINFKTFRIKEIQMIFLEY